MEGRPFETLLPSLILRFLTSLTVFGHFNCKKNPTRITLIVEFYFIKRTWLKISLLLNDFVSKYLHLKLEPCGNPIRRGVAHCLYYEGLADCLKLSFIFTKASLPGFWHRFFSLIAKSLFSNEPFRWKVVLQTTIKCLTSSIFGSFLFFPPPPKCLKITFLKT